MIKSSIKRLLPFLLSAVALFSGCDRGGYSRDSVQRYSIRKVDVGLTRKDDKDIATVVVHCVDQTFHFTSSDLSGPSAIVERFRHVLPVAADFKAQGQSSCELVVGSSQYHSMTLSDNSNPPQKDALFRFRPNTDLCQSFWVQDFAWGQPAQFTPVFTQELQIPLVVEDKHWIQTKAKSPP